MAFFQMEYYSDTLKYTTTVNVIIPRKSPRKMKNDAENNKYPVLYLLHGLSDDCLAWYKHTPIEDYSEQYGIAIVMPNVLRSWYCDSSYGNYETFVVDEIPRVCQHYFGCLSDMPSKTFIAGNSMGGYGSFKLALAHSEKFAAAMSISGALASESKDVCFDEVNAALDGAPLKEKNNIKYLVKLCVKEHKAIPKLFQTCGKEDFLYKGNQELRKLFTELQLDHTYFEAPGSHSWPSFDEGLKKGLEWLFENK